MGGGTTFPLLEAAPLGWHAVLRLLRRGADPNDSLPDGTTVLLLLAGRPGMLATAQQLLGWHAVQVRDGAPQRLRLTQVDREGRDAVGVALAASNRSFAEALLAQLMAQEQQGLGQVQALTPAQGEELKSAATEDAGAGAATVGAGAAEEPPAVHTPQKKPLPPASRLQGSNGNGNGSAAWAVTLLQQLGGKCGLADINRPGRDGQHLLMAQASAPMDLGFLSSPGHSF